MDGEQVQRRDGLYGFEFRERDLRRLAVGEAKRYNLKQLWQLSHEIIRLSALGYKGTDIAEILNISPQTVSNTINSDLGKHKLSELRMERDEDVKLNLEKVRVLTRKALEVYHEVLDNENGEATLKDRKGVADTVVLELSGLRVPTKVQSTNVNLTAEELAEIKARGIAAAREAGLVIDVVPENGNGDNPKNGTSEE